MRGVSNKHCLLTFFISTCSIQEENKSPDMTEKKKNLGQKFLIYGNFFFRFRVGDEKKNTLKMIRRLLFSELLCFIIFFNLQKK